ncbi:MAG: riboflavin synthase [Clostridiales bacterium]|jgi:riboflavin synthase|nr:riboflavin synthase [Clostridiales bacterium]
MFTGIIEEIGTVERVIPGVKSSQLIIQGSKVLEDTKVGDSICTSGVCLTVTRLSDHTFSADVMAETMRRSKLGSLKAGSLVNLERALRLDTRLGGHIVSGHIDGIGAITAMEREDNAVWVTVSTEKDLLRYIVEKGSIAIDGISLTLATVREHDFQVSIIPHTGTETTLLKQHPGDLVNLECDIIGKYVEKLIGLSTQTTAGISTISEDFLRENGFF